MMPTIAVRSFENLYTALPVTQRQRLDEQAQAYIKALDRAIAQILSPTIGRADDQFLMTDEVIPLYGVGPTPEAAMADYCSVVIEYYESLVEDERVLGHTLREQLDVLRRVLALAEQGITLSQLKQIVAGKLDRKAYYRVESHKVVPAKVSQSRTGQIAGVDVEQEQASGLAGELLDGHIFTLQYDGLYRIDLYTATYARENTHPVVFRIQPSPPAPLPRPALSEDEGSGEGSLPDAPPSPSQGEEPVLSLSKGQGGGAIPYAST